MRAAALACVLLLATQATAQEAAGRLPVCLSCHGQNGQSLVQNVPSLGAMPVNYLLTQLYLFREKLRVADPMNAMAAGLTDEDLRTLGAKFNAMPSPPPAAELTSEEQAEGQALVEKYHCNSCHGANLAGQQTIPHIADQREDYLRKSLIAYKTNTRKGYSPAMNEVSQDISDDDIPKLAKYVASFKPPHD